MSENETPKVCGKCGRSKCSSGYCPFGNDLRYTFPVEIGINKSSKNPDSSRINVTITASDPTPDRVNDVILLSAFDKARESFLSEGILDYDHGSIRGTTDLEKSRAIIGKPTEMETKSGKVIVSGYLFRSNPIVTEALLPALEAGSDVFGASVGGRIIQKSLVWDESAARKVNRISRITLNHVACTPRYKAVHPGTAFSLAKSLDEEKGTLEFESFGAFARSFESSVTTHEGESIEKALEAGFETDSALMTGGQVLQPQSLEEDLLRPIFDDFLSDVRTGKLQPSLHAVVGWLVNRGLAPEKAREIAEVLATKASEIATALKSSRRMR